MKPKRKVLLIRPQALTGKYAFTNKQFPMNLAALATFLIQAGVETKIYDFDVERFNEEVFKASLQADQPDIVGISCCTPSIINGHKIASLVKRCSPHILTVVGGHHASALPERTLLEFPDFDVVVIGEGEQTLLDICRGSDLSPNGLKEIAGLTFRSKGRIFRTAKRELILDLDSLPFPERELLPIHLYRGQSHRGFSRDFLRITELMTSRGCPGKCIFCASEVVMGKSLRFRSAENVKAEINHCVERFGFNHFTISDDTFTLNIPRLEKICEHFKELRVTWNCNACVWPISKDILDMMERSGCKGIAFGVESGSPRILELIGKKISVQHIKDAFHWARQSGIKLIEANLIIGSHPSETYEDVNLSIKLINEISPDMIMVSVIVPYPGTEVYALMREKGLLDIPEKWDEYLFYGGRPSWRTENFSSEELVSIQRDILNKFYLRPGYIFRRILTIKNFKELKYWLSAGSAFLFNRKVK